MNFVYRNNLAAKLFANKKYRDAYVLEHVKNSIPNQIRALREQREWKQSELGEKAGKQQHGIARLEDPRIGHKLSIKTLLELASAFDVALLVKFVPFSRLVKEYEDVSFEALSAASVTDEKEIEKLNEWAVEDEVEPIAAHALDVIEAGRDELPTTPVYGLAAPPRRSGPTQPKFGFMYSRPEAVAEPVRKSEPAREVAQSFEHFARAREGGITAGQRSNSGGLLRAIGKAAS